MSPSTRTTKGAKDVPGNYRGISLLSIPGKVYASILLHRITSQVENQLSEAQCGFRPNRGTVDAIYALRTLGAACGEFNMCLAKAYIDLTKAYDSVNRWALWKVLRLYNVPAKLIALLEDLHTGTTAAVRLDGKLGPAFEVTAGVRQGCVAAPMLFNVFIDHVIRKALSRMPDDCGVRIHVLGRNQPANHTADAESCPIERIVMLMYADDVVLLSHDPQELAEMLVVIDQVAREYGMTINAAKTEIQVQQPARGGAVPVPEVQLSGGVVKTASEFKYLGSWIQEDWGMDKEVAVRRAKGLAAFQSFSNVWTNKKLQLAHKMRVYHTHVIPYFLYGMEAGNWTAAHVSSLETAHTACLRRIMGVSRADRHTLQHIRTTCSSKPLELLLFQRTFRWLGHVMRMPDHRYPAMTFNCMPVGGRRGRGRPKATFRHTHEHMVRRLGGVGDEEVDPQQWLGSGMYNSAQDRVSWRARVAKLTLKLSKSDGHPPQRTRAYLSRACKEGGSC